MCLLKFADQVCVTCVRPDYMISHRNHKRLPIFGFVPPGKVYDQRWFINNIDDDDDDDDDDKVVFIMDPFRLFLTLFQSHVGWAELSAAEFFLKKRKLKAWLTMCVCVCVCVCVLTAHWQGRGGHWGPIGSLGIHMGTMIRWKLASLAAKCQTVVPNALPTQPFSSAR